MEKEKRNKLLLGDLHVLSHYGLAPETFTISGGVTLVANEGQKRLLKYWKHMCKSVKEMPFDEAWIIGDVFAGLNPREFGKSKSGIMDDQLLAGLEIVLMLPEQLKLKIWSGTGYHESMDTRLHQRLTENLQREGRVAEFKGSWSFEDVGRRKIFVTHPASAAVVYPHTPMYRDSLFFKKQGFEGKLPKVDVIVRAHKHSYNYIDDYIHVVQVPGWQIYVPYGRALKWFAHWQSDIGAAFLLFDKEYRIDVKPWLYPPFLMTEEGKLVEVPYDPKRFVEGWN